MRKLSLSSCVSSCGVAAAMLLLSGSAADAQSNYFALGDSYAFGYTTPSGTGTGNGAPSGGYYSAVANYLAMSIGSTVTTTNLAIPGETTYSFFGNSDPYLPLPVTHSIADNTNYTTQTTQSGELSSLANAKPSFVTLQIGGNDIIQYLYESLYISGTSPATVAASLPAVIAATMTNYANIIAQAKADAAPNAQIFVVDYADPFIALNSAQNPGALSLGGLDVPATQEFDSALQSLAQSTGVGFVDIASAFSNNMSANNYIGNFFYINDSSADASGIPDFHPNAQGYAVIAGQIENAAAAPEPDAGILILASGICVAGLRTIRRRDAR